MTSLTWQLQNPASAILFDCDGTLSAIEGIDVLAEKNGVGDLVKSLTSQAMGKTGLTCKLYQERLGLVQPTLEQTLSLGKEYFANRAPDVLDVIQLLKRLKKSIYILSAGLSPAVKGFGELLQISPANIFAVDINFDFQGRFLNFAHDSPLVENEGKRVIVDELKKNHKNLIYIGDGLNDYATYDLVTRFIGYGGFYYRQNIADMCEYYIHSASMTALLPLILTQPEYEILSPAEQSLYHQGLKAIQSGEVKY